VIRFPVRDLRKDYRPWVEKPGSKIASLSFPWRPGIGAIDRRNFLQTDPS
jgi:hypothetical protein